MNATPTAHAPTPAQPASAPPTAGRFPLGRAFAVISAVGGVALALALVVIWLASAPGQASIAVSTWGLCVFATAVALVAIERAARLGLDKVALAALAAMIIRLAIVGLGAGVMIRGLGWALEPVALWSAAWYLLLLAAEVLIVYRYVAAATPAAGPEPRSSL